jgi:hypothetical protein
MAKPHSYARSTASVAQNEHRKVCGFLTCFNKILFNYLLFIIQINKVLLKQVKKPHDDLCANYVRSCGSSVRIVSDYILGD